MIVDKELRKRYKPSIGIECHVQLKTKTKLFSAVANDARHAEPNTLVSHICFGLPGALPVLNEKAVELASIAGLALNTRPQKFSSFDRKHYFYPDLPKGYQITQYEKPIVVGGFVEIVVDGKPKKIRITRAHLEEDAGKNIHPKGRDYSLVDLNRVGTPLIEIVSEPDMNSATEAKAYTRELYLIMKYANVSDANLFYGNMRFDVNVSVSKDSSKLGTRSETKNLNSFRAVEKAIEYEIDRQIEVLEKHGKIKQETRGWDDAKQRTFSQRSKEEAQDYRYFPDPDLPPVEIDEKFISSLSKAMPVLPNEWRKKLSVFGVDGSHVETLLDAHVELIDEEYLQLIQENLSDKEFIKALVNWMVNIDIPLFRESAKSHRKIDRSTIYVGVYKLLHNGQLSSTKAKELIAHLLTSDKPLTDLQTYAEENGFIQSSDEDEIGKIITKVIELNPKAVADIKSGQDKAIGFLVGQVMKESKGKVNPQVAENLIKDRIK
jgi:aspartyl-tRNA(Asn)/glutamyl-tRNA(Gln) amidotransferase subunit B